MEKNFVRTTPAEIKKALKREFNFTFSVSKSNGSSSWYDVKWIDGPAYGKVSAFLQKYNDDGRDEIQTDLFCGAQYTLLHRTLSNEALILGAQEVAKFYGLPIPSTEISTLSGQVVFLQDPQIGRDSLSTYAYRWANERDLS